MQLHRLSQWLFAAIIAFTLASCSDQPAVESESVSGTEKLIGLSQLPEQEFTINSDRDTVIAGKGGTRLYIPKQAFTDSQGRAVKGVINVTLKEAIKPADILQSGLTTTTTDGDYLSTGGMFYIDAKQQGQTLLLASGKTIQGSIPGAKPQDGMQLYTGIQHGGELKWGTPVDLQNVQLAKEDRKAVGDRGGLNREVLAPEGGNELDAIMDYVDSDTAGIATHQEERTTQAERPRPRGFNSFASDYKTEYIFTLKKLGWANIDRLFSDPATKKVQLATIIEDAASYPEVYVTLIMPQHSVYIAGYQKKDGSFSFTHDDQEAPQLPVGAEATLLATAYKSDKPYYAIKKFKIAEKDRQSLVLNATTEAELKTTLEREL